MYMASDFNFSKTQPEYSNLLFLTFVSYRPYLWLLFINTTAEKYGVLNKHNLDKQNFTVLQLMDV